MTLREIGQFLFEFTTHSADIFFWRVNWLDANVIALMIVIVAYVILYSILHTMIVELVGRAGGTRAVIRWCLACGFFLFLSYVPSKLISLFVLPPATGEGFLIFGTMIWWGILIDGFTNRKWGSRLLNFFGTKVFVSKGTNWNGSD